MLPIVPSNIFFILFIKSQKILFGSIELAPGDQKTLSPKYRMQPSENICLCVHAVVKINLCFFKIISNEIQKCPGIPVPCTVGIKSCRLVKVLERKIVSFFHQIGIGHPVEIANADAAKFRNIAKPHLLDGLEAVQVHFPGSSEIVCHAVGHGPIIVDGRVGDGCGEKPRQVFLGSFEITHLPQ